MKRLVTKSYRKASFVILLVVGCVVYTQRETLLTTSESNAMDQVATMGQGDELMNQNANTIQGLSVHDPANHKLLERNLDGVFGLNVDSPPVHNKVDAILQDVTDISRGTTERESTPESKPDLHDVVLYRPPDQTIGYVHAYMHKARRPRQSIRATNIKPEDTTFIHNTKFGNKPITGEFKCDVPCVWVDHIEGAHASVINQVGGSRGSTLVKNLESYPDVYNIAFSMEGEHKYGALKNFGEYDAEMTYRWASEIKKSYFEFKEYNIFQPALDFDTAIKQVTFLARNCQGDRTAMLDAIEPYIHVAAIGACRHNTDWDSTLDKTDKKGMLRKYLFHFAWENGVVDDYVTEKVYHALSSGTIPVYHGAKNIDDYVPEGSIIKMTDFESLNELGIYLDKLAHDKEAYMKYHVWRDDPSKVEKMKKRFSWSYVETECRVCRWTYAQRYGLDWDADSQTFS